MFNLQRYEKGVIIFLVLTLLLGLSVTAFKKYHSGIKISIKHSAVNNMPAAEPDGNYLPQGRTININEASPNELMKIKGVGKVLAVRIVEYRSQKGLFVTTTDIKNVKGIGPALFEKIKDRISVE